MPQTPFYNAHHSPVGAFATFTLGFKGQSGGFGLELAGPACENVYLGLEASDRPGTFQTLPFYETSASAAQDYDVEGHGEVTIPDALETFSDAEIQRALGAGIDTWRAGDMTVRIVSPPRSLQDPDAHDVRGAVAPSVIVELTVDNRAGKAPRRAFFGYAGSDRTVGMRTLNEPGLVGVGQGTSIAIACRDADVYAGLAWRPEVILQPSHRENLGFMLGNIGLLVGSVPAGESRTFRFAVGFFKDGTATTGIRTRYLYRRYFNRVEEVLRHALANADATIALAESFDQRLESQLSPDRAFMAAHAIRSYFGSTQLLEREDGRALWVVHEGEYRMMNTFDLTVDQAFFELAMNPWTVRNVLDLFVERYAYDDKIRRPNSEIEYPGGIAFTHDMGVSNAFSPAGHSGYEQAGLTGCFSYMSAEELMNWVLTAGLYVSHTNDADWAARQGDTFRACLASLLNRDDPDPMRRNGVVGLDAARCKGGAEITTYDSLDTSLGQARNSVYLAVKGWASLITLERIFGLLGDADSAAICTSQAELASATIQASANADGMFPAIIGEGVEARIIPAIEALVYPFVTGCVDARFAPLRDVLERHFDAVMKRGICKFDDGAWKLSSTSQNSWLSKIYLCQYVAEAIFGKEADSIADASHVAWLVDSDNGFYAWSDQMLAGKAVGSRYYPRGVTSVLWLGPGERPIEAIRRALTS